MKKVKSYRKQLALQRLSALLLTGIVGFSGYQLTHLSSAATGYNHNPVGFINSCGLVGANTTIYGWAYDADTGTNNFPKVQVNAGSSSTVAYTSVNQYKEGDINAYLRANRPNDPITGQYGFEANVGQLYKGSSYRVSGVALNEGTGSNANLQIDIPGSNGDGIGVNGHTALTASQTLPDACLGLTRVVPTPAPPPAPTPTPTPTPTNPTPAPTPTTPTKTGTGTTTTKSSASKSAAPSSTANDTHTGQSDGTVAVGTLSASVTLPSDGATSAYLLYGTSPDNLDSSSDDSTVDGDKASVVLTYLQPKSTYYYQIVRTSAAGTITTSPNGTFQTAGYGITLHFIDADKHAVSGLTGVLDDTDESRSKSDKNGDLKFADLDAGSYDLKYEYKKLTYTSSFDTDNASTDDNSSGKVVVLHNTVNVSTLKDGSSTPLPAKKHGSAVKVLLFLFLILVIGGIITWLVVRRRRNQINTAYSGYATPYPIAGPGVIDTPAPQSPAIPPTAPVPASPTVAQPTGEPLEHVGESLREMVIQSMHEEAERRKSGEHSDTTFKP